MFVDLNARPGGGQIITASQALGDQRLTLTAPYSRFYKRINNYGTIACVPYTGRGTGAIRWMDRFITCAGNAVFAYEFDGNANDLSGGGHPGTLSGSMTYTTDDPVGIAPNGVLQQAANFTGSNFYSISTAAAVLGNADRTLVVICKPNISSAVSGSTLMYMGGGDPGSVNTFRAFGVGFAGSAAAPKLRLDYTRNVDDFSLPTSYFGVWIAIIVTHTAGAQKVYAARLYSDVSFTLIGTAARTLNTGFVGTNGNWIGQWNAIRRYIGAMAFLGMRDAVFTQADINRFLYLP